MKATTGHLVYWVAPANFGFYKNLFQALGWTVGYDAEYGIGVMQEGASSLWFMSAVEGAPPGNYDTIGFNHLGLHAPGIADVDAAQAWLNAKGVKMLFETPRHRPEYSVPGSTYYQIMFESPDKLLFEIVYIGPV